MKWKENLTTYLFTERFPNTPQYEENSAAVNQDELLYFVGVQETLRVQLADQSVYVWNQETGAWQDRDSFDKERIEREKQAKQGKNPTT